MDVMSRSFFWRGLVLLTSTTGLIIGCSGGTPPEGDLPKTRAGTPEEIQNIQKKLEQEKVGKGATYQPPPNVNLPKK
jgi:hypothetical protein